MDPQKEEVEQDNYLLTHEPVVSKPARDVFIEAVNRDGLESEQTQEAQGKYLDVLQQESDNLPGNERVLWFNYQLAKTYFDLEMWEEVINIIEDLYQNWENFGDEKSAFVALQQQIPHQEP